MRKVLVLLLSSGAMAPCGVLTVDAAPALAKKCHCKRGPRGPRGPRGRRGLAGARGRAGSAGPAGPAGPGLNNWDGVLKTPGQVQSVTIGSFTLTDAEASSGTGCTNMNLVNSSSQNGELKATFQTGGAVEYYLDKLTPGETYMDIISANQLDETFQAVLGDGSSMISGLVGNWNGTALSNGTVPCINTGGVAGT